MPTTTNQPEPQPIALDVFETSIGWVVVHHVAEKIRRIRFGFASRADAYRACSDATILPLVGSGNRWSSEVSDSSRTRPVESFATWREPFIAYGEGNDVSFAELELDLEWMTPFQASVVAACRRIPRGQTVTYGELAILANSPGAAQAVGTVMKTNRFPIVIPCHRVLAASGLGGYSAGSGVDAKRRLLELEGALSPLAEFPLFD